MKNCYINGIGSVSIQTPEYSVFDAAPEKVQHLNYAQQPSYKELIAPAMSRRMARGIKMSIYATNQAMNEAENPDLDAIIAGTSLGCIEDSEKFLNTIIENGEEFLTPTAFIQSTHNTVAAQIALQLQCKSYNFTYVNGGNSFESALFDGLLQLKFNNAENILVGGVDEIAPYTYSMFEMIGRVKSENTSADFINPLTAGVPYAEGSNFFVLSSEKKPESYAKIDDVTLVNELPENGATFVLDFLSKNNLKKEDIDVVFFGVNADKNQQHFYDELTQQLFAQTPIAYYQHLSGSYDTASAYGLKVAAEVLKKQSYPEQIQWNELKPTRLQRILLVHQSQQADYSLVLLSKC